MRSDFRINFVARVNVGSPRKLSTAMLVIDTVGLMRKLKSTCPLQIQKTCLNLINFGILNTNRFD